MTQSAVCYSKPYATEIKTSKCYVRFIKALISPLITRKQMTLTTGFVTKFANSRLIE